MSINGWNAARNAVASAKSSVGPAPTRTEAILQVVSLVAPRAEASGATPVASWQTALGLGFLSSVFDNIPLTAPALKQGGYDWGFLAYAVGFGGSMIWFGSSAGVAISNMYPEAKSVGLWLRHGWFVAVAYIVGFFVMLAIVGWNADAPHKKRVEMDVNYQLAAAGLPG